jgi:DNA-binding transcriptional ArsR family regulator
MTFSSCAGEKMAIVPRGRFARRRTEGRNASGEAEASARAAKPRERYIASMSEVLDMAAIAALVGDPARANILCALLDGRALTASELAYAAHVTPQTASGHLGKLARANLIEPAQQGRHRYFKLAGRHVAAMLESISAVASIAPPRLRPIRIGNDMRAARMCYDHVAGQLGVVMADALREHGHVEFAEDGGMVTPSGEAFLVKFGVDLSASRQSRRVFCRPCIDWSERRAHLAGAVGAALASRLMDLRWIARKRDSRALTITPIGWANIERTFGCSLHDHTVHAQPTLRVVAG